MSRSLSDTTLGWAAHHRSWQRPAVLLVSLLVVLAIGLWSYAQIRDSMRELRADSLQALLATEIEALDLWIGELKQEAMRLASDPAVRRPTQALAAIAATNEANAADRLVQAPGRRALLELFPLRGESRLGTHVIDARGVVLFSRLEPYTGRSVAPEVLEQLHPVFRGRSAFLHPGTDRERLPGLPQSVLEHPLFWVAVPVRDERGAVIAALAFGYRADRELAGLFAAAEFGRSGKMYAFNGRARLLAGNPAAVPTPGEVHRTHVVEPDSDRLTRLAAAALGSREAPVAEQSGIILDPYTSFRGHEVIGAWRWLPEYEMGLAVEMRVDEAYAPLRYVKLGIASALALVLVGWSVLALPRGRLTRWLRGGPRVGPYRLVRKIGEGAISDIYLARHKLLKRMAAVKILKPAVASDEWIARFKREAQLASQLSHPNTIAIYDYGLTADRRFYCAMEYLEGLSLAELVERHGPVPVARAIHILRQVCASLAEAHAKRLVHRDIKPPNIMLCRVGGANDVVKVLDFGLVKPLDGTQTRDLTRSLQILGTPLYMAPERVRNPGVADPRSDLYAVGAVGYWLLTGRRLFETETDHDLTYHILHVEAPRASAHAPQPVPAALDELIARCLAKDPAERPADAGELQQALERLQAEHPWNEVEIEAWWDAHPSPVHAAEAKL